MVLFPQTTDRRRSYIRYLLVASLVLGSGFGNAFSESLVLGKPFGQPQFLPVDEAFLLTVTREEETLQLHWLVKPGYYLYKDRLNFNVAKNPTLPAGLEKWDEIFGDVEVYYTELSITLPISQDFVGDSGKFVVGYQGCADAGLCYPPQEREFELDKF